MELKPLIKSIIWSHPAIHFHSGFLHIQCAFIFYNKIRAWAMVSFQHKSGSLEKSISTNDLYPHDHGNMILYSDFSSTHSRHLSLSTRNAFSCVESNSFSHLIFSLNVFGLSKSGSWPRFLAYLSWGLSRTALHDTCNTYYVQCSVIATLYLLKLL